ncbi:hypothetical protein AYL99_01556 [Fonsecaea erecta]|uniref:Uncharacterized protein n=1 Tax=Fonsecaea erecta TaxID=1367422 RepID=A0A179A0C5_9EURO|nr:hypothetical protein AYL99_01556 [Fonsecaea erecta]OAP65584.1 hypothetical protein AYL99_01556 [Fonsecaea erecta]
MSQLPSQIRKDVRDLFDNEENTVQKSLAGLGETIGCQVLCRAEWLMLWAELQHLWADMTTFVPTIAKVVEMWCDTLGRRLKDGRFEGWTEVFLEKLKTVNVLKLSIQVAADRQRVQTAWLGPRSASLFTISLSQIAQLQQTMGQTAASSFAEDFESMFEPPSSQKETKGQQYSAREDEEDWAELESVPDTTKSTAHSVNTTVNRVPPYSLPDLRVDILPALETLPRPEILFRTTTPYVMLVSSNAPNKITINGTHESSLQLLAEYLQRWIRTDPQDVRKIPYLRIKLNESSFGLGLFHDSLTIEPFDHHQRHVVVNISLVLAFIQGVLGYQRVYETSTAGQWEFRRDILFEA